MPPSQAARKKKQQPTEYVRGTIVVRLTREVHQRIVEKAGWRESIDQTLRRIFKMGPWKPKKNGEK